jgi:LmbE family N-acetylglucosaminyl deacetylase
MVTNGAPRDLVDAHAYGFATADDYAAARRAELGAALALAGWAGRDLISLHIPDQQAAFALSQVAQRLAAIFQERNTEVVLTHAYEGGHPDHDATAFAVHAAVRARSAAAPIGIVEIPFYHLGPHGDVWQSFADADEPGGIELRLSAAERGLKERMSAAHVTQRDTLAPFTAEAERFRPAPAYDFRQLPNGGRILYDRYGWGLNSGRWCELVHASLAEMHVSA